MAKIKNLSVIIIILSLSVISCSIEEEIIEFDMRYISSGIIKIGINLEGGGQISYLTYKKSENLIDNYDYGREIQFTLRDEDSPGPGYEQRWNPTQGGTAFNGSGVLAFSKENKTLYTLTRPYHFLGGRSDILMHQWISFYNEEIIYVELEVNYLDSETRFGCHEWPAAYLTTNYKRLIFYQGDRPWSYDQVTNINVFGSRDYPSHTAKPTENWAALVNKNNFGITLYSGEDIDFITYMYVSGENSTTHIALRKCTEMVPGETYYYAYYIIPGNYQHARELIYEIKNQ